MRTATQLGCIVDDCSWTYIEPDPAAHIDGHSQTVEDMVNRAMSAHAAAVDAVVRAHLESHTIEEHVRTIARLRGIEQRAAEVFGGDLDQPVGVIGRATARYILGNPSGCPDHWVLGEGNHRVAVPVFGCAACQAVIDARPVAAAEREG